MLSRIPGIVCVVVALMSTFASPLFANESTVAAGDESMHEVVRELQEQVARQQEELDEQAARLDEAEARAVGGAASEATSGSSVSRFLEATEIRSWINVNYTWNSRGNGNTHIIGQNSNTGFHHDNHSFKVDQLWFQIDKPVSSESRAGFHTDIAFGETARNAQLAFGGNDSVTVYTAYASFLAPGGYGGIRIDAGELWTLIGAEVVPATENLNITRGMVWNLQPVSHTGAIVSTNLGPFSFAFGAVNAVVSDSATDTDRNKALTGQIAFTAEKFDIAASFIHGSRIGTIEDSGDPIDDAEPDGPFFPINNDRGHSDLTMGDLVITGDPTEDTTFYINFTYVWDHPDGAPNANTYATAVAGRYALTERTGVASRYEFVLIDPSNGKATDEVSLTFTIDHLVTDNLTARVEGRFDWGINGKYKKAGTPYSASRGANHQKLFLAEAIYAF
ncbi:MAG: outer membrane beta-barrel protein [Myxococcota bacterium]|jgi:hypothetical protein|nr:outer membrane beta-barrel protein [Myxococcota bacterium]